MIQNPATDSCLMILALSTMSSFSQRHTMRAEKEGTKTLGEQRAPQPLLQGGQGGQGLSLSLSLSPSPSALGLSCLAQLSGHRLPRDRVYHGSAAVAQPFSLRLRSPHRRRNAATFGLPRRPITDEEHAPRPRRAPSPAAPPGHRLLSPPNPLSRRGSRAGVAVSGTGFTFPHAWSSRVVVLRWMTPLGCSPSHGRHAFHRGRRVRGRRRKRSGNGGGGRL